MLNSQPRVQGLGQYFLGSTEGDLGFISDERKSLGKSPELCYFVTGVFGFGSPRKNLPKARAMDFITSTAILPLLFGCLGVFGLFRLLQWVRGKAYLRHAVVVITGATSGLGKGGCWRQCCQGVGGSQPAMGSGPAAQGPPAQMPKAAAEVQMREVGWMALSLVQVGKAGAKAQ